MGRDVDYRDQGVAQFFEARANGVNIIGLRAPAVVASDIDIELLYREDGHSVLTGIQRISRPGLRVYVQKREIPRVYGGLGIAILSTPRGVMTGHRARQQNVGGEVMCYVW